MDSSYARHGISNLIIPRSCGSLYKRQQHRPCHLLGMQRMGMGGVASIPQDELEYASSNHACTCC